MATNGLNWQTITLPFSGSLDTKEDNRISNPPDLDPARDVQFEDIGGLQTRPPFTAMSNSIFGGGTLSNCRKLAVVNGELCVFTDTKLYSWNAELAKWVLRGTHLAVTVDETPRFVTTGDQVDGDRAELNGTIVYAWTEGTTVYAAACDKTTGAVLMPPTAVAGTMSRPRLVALATRILLFVFDNANTSLKVLAIDPASPATGVGGALTTVVATTANSYYDVVRAGPEDWAIGACRLSPTTSYLAFTVTSDPAIETVTKAQTADGPLAVATTADGSLTQVIRANGTNIQGDLLITSSLAGVFSGQAIGTVSATPINQITAAFVSTTCTVFWSSDERTDGPTNSFLLKKNTVTTANVIGTQSTITIGLGIASRAFVHGTDVYVWSAFGSDSTTFGSGSPLGIRAQLQNTYFLYRADGIVVSKATWQVAGGLAPSIGHLPGMTAVDSNNYAWLGAFRQRLELGDNVDHTGYAARTIKDIRFAFDDNDARRTTVAGRTLYISGGVVSQYDGVGVFEVGFFVYPWAFAASDTGSAGHNLSAGVYNWKSTMRWRNAQGEVERSTTATGEQVTIAASHRAELKTAYLHITNKLTSLPNIELWRTQANASNDAPYYLATSQDPNGTGTNPYVPNHSTVLEAVITDDMSDTVLTTKEANPEIDGILESLAPPGGTILVPTETRVFLTGISDDPDGVWPSRERGDGEIVSFHDSLRFSVPPAGGAITALWVDDQFVYVARETAIYAFAGPGISNDGTGQNFTLVRTISRDVGVVSQEAQASTPVGRLVKSSKGWYIIDGSGGLRYVGSSVADFDGDTVVAVHTITAKHQVRILTTSRLLLWDYRGLIDATKPGEGRWAEWTIGGGLDAVLFGGIYTYLAATGPSQESATFSGLTYGMDVATAWIKPADLMGAVAMRGLQPIGEWESAHLLRCRIAYNYDETVVDDIVWSPPNSVAGTALQLAHGPKRRSCEALKVRLTAVAAGVQATMATASALSHVVATSGTNWAATWAAKTGNNAVIGELGNKVTMSISFISGTPNVVDVRDGYSYDATTGVWSELLNNVGVRVVCATGSLTVAALESAIAAGSGLVQLSAADATPTKTIDAVTMTGLAPTGTFTGGTFTSPTGAALKLAGLGLEVGIKRGLYKRLPAAQKA